MFLITFGIFAIKFIMGAINVFKINDVIAKIVTQVLVIVLNYVFSKLIIFKKPGGILNNL